jgi:hypothetical protein
MDDGDDLELDLEVVHLPLEVVAHEFVVGQVEAEPGRQSHGAHCVCVCVLVQAAESERWVYVGRNHGQEEEEEEAAAAAAANIIMLPTTTMTQQANTNNGPGI